MKQEEMSDMCTILVEEQDRCVEVMEQVRKQHKPVVIVVPERASQVFQRPEDFHDLKRVKRESGIPVTLILPGHERIRNWARRQGFTVYASSETCAKALARRDRLNALRGIMSTPYSGRLTAPPLSEQDDEEDDALWSWETEEPPDEEEVPGASSSRSAAPESIKRFGTAWRITGDRWEMAWPTSERTTDGIVSLAWQEQAAQHGEAAMSLSLTQLVPSIQAGAVDRGEETLAARTPTREVSTYQEAPITEPLYNHYDQWSNQHEKVIPRERARKHTLVLVLTILLILGILGGISFGFVLSLLHTGLGMLPLMEHLSFL
jgi:hypothetical protein